MRMPVGIWSLCLIALVAGCGADESPGEASREPPPFPGSVAATSWRTTEDPPEWFGRTGDRFGSPFATLQALMTFGVQQDGGLPQGTRLVGDILDADATTGRAWMQLIGSGEDSVAGSEFLLLLKKDGRAGSSKASHTGITVGVAWTSPATRASEHDSNVRSLGYNTGPWRRPDGRGRDRRKAAPEESPSSIEQVRG